MQFLPRLNWRRSRTLFRRLLKQRFNHSHTTTLSRLLPRFSALQVLVFLLWRLRTASIVPWTKPSTIKYVDFFLLLPETLYQTQTPALQLRYEYSLPGYLGSPLTVVKRKKPVVDSFQKWLDAFMAYMLVIVSAYPNRAVELIKYQQIISRAVTKFKGLAWYTYDEHFRRRAARDLTIAWDRIDIELWTVTFTGTAKPHCSICSSPYHQSDDCPHQEPSKKPRRSALGCFDFNKPSGCQRRTCHLPDNCRRCGSSSHALFNCPSSKQHATSTKSATPGDRCKK